jgi:hypothetical protein
VHHPGAAGLGSGTLEATEPVKPTALNGRRLSRRTLAGEPKHYVERGGRTGPVLTQESGTGPSEHGPQHQRDENRIVELPGHGDEVGNQVERHRQVADEGEEKEFSRARDPLIAQETANEHHAIGYEAGDGPRSLAPAAEKQEAEEARVEGYEDGNADCGGLEQRV